MSVLFRKLIYWLHPFFQMNIDMKMKYLYLPALLLLTLVACKGEEEPETPVETPVEVTNPRETQIEALFDENTVFEKDTMRGLLKELGMGMCNPDELDQENYKLPPCSPKFFKFFSYKDGSAIENAFVLLIKARVHDFPLRRVFVFQREKGNLVKVNGFVANLIGKRKSASGYEDLILRFADKDQNHFNCLYVWRNKRYEYARVEEINDSPIKAALQDSMNVEIHEVLKQYKMEF